MMTMKCFPEEGEEPILVDFFHSPEVSVAADLAAVAAALEAAVGVSVDLAAAAVLAAVAHLADGNSLIQE